MAKINAFRRIALGQPGEKSGIHLAGLFSDEDLVALRQALEAIAQLQDSDPEYFEEQTSDETERNHPIDSTLAAAEAVWPGIVQQSLGWTRLRYFEAKQLGFAPGLIERLPPEFRTTVYGFKLRGLPLFKSALATFFNRKAKRLHIWLLEKDMRRTWNVGAAGILGTLSISADGSYEFIPEGTDVSGQDTGTSEPDEPEERSIPWAGFAIAFVLFWLVFGCIREIF